MEKLNTDYYSYENLLDSTFKAINFICSNKDLSEPLANASLLHSALLQALINKVYSLEEEVKKLKEEK